MDASSDLRQHRVVPRGRAQDVGHERQPEARAHIARHRDADQPARVLADDRRGGTDLTLTETGVPAKWREENRAGWVSVLMALKAAIDFDVDVRSHDPQRTWDQGFVEN